MHSWLPSYIAQARQRRPVIPNRSLHLLLCIADHFEPQCGRVSAAQAQARLRGWQERYPQLCERFHDSDGRPPRHSFFFPIDEYVPEHVDAVAALCRPGYGEVEIHHHHDHDTAAALSDRLHHFVQLFKHRHGLLPRHKASGETRYGFIHGNWALNNSRPDGRWCGINNEITILKQTGCYADFTLPSYPSSTQTRTINRIYYAVGHTDKPKGHDRGWLAGDPHPNGRGRPPADALLLIQGPLVLNWRRRKAGLIPRVENACLQANQPPTMERLNLWLRARVQVPSRPDWFFIKLHTHGAPEANQAMLLGDPMSRFHADLAQRAARDPHFHYHYVTAREMYNLAKAAEAGWQGSVADARDYELTWTP